MSKREKVPGIFIHTHMATGSYYIGVSADVHRGVVEDQRRLRKKEHFSTILQKLYDEKPFIVSRTVVCKDYVEANNLRRKMVAEDYANPLLLNKSAGLNVCAVYKVTHTPSGFFYIGSTHNFTSRKHHHEWCLIEGRHSVQKLQQLFNINPDLTLLKWEVILASPREYAYGLEQTMVDKAQADPFLLNKAPHVKGGNGGFEIGEELREKRRVAAKKQWAEGRMRDPSVSGASKKVSIDGNIYDSVVAASKQLNLATHHIYRRVKSDEWPSYQYL